jgi:hypothetical protein
MRRLAASGILNPAVLVSTAKLRSPPRSARGADIDHLGLERGHRTLTITRKGGGRHHPAGAADRHGAGRIVRRTAPRGGKAVTPRGHRTPTITRKDGAVITCCAHTAYTRAIGLAATDCRGLAANSVGMSVDTFCATA